MPHYSTFWSCPPMSTLSKQFSTFLLLPITLLLLVTSSAFAETPSTISAENVHRMISGLSDEQVRSLLLEELQKNSQAHNTQAETPDGPGAVLEGMLTGLEDLSASNDGRAKELFAKVPEVLPDLYKVFVKL